MEDLRLPPASLTHSRVFPPPQTWALLTTAAAPAALLVVVVVEVVLVVAVQGEKDEVKVGVGVRVADGDSRVREKEEGLGDCMKPNDRSREGLREKSALNHDVLEEGVTAPAMGLLGSPMKRRRRKRGVMGVMDLLVFLGVSSPPTALVGSRGGMWMGLRSSHSEMGGMVGEP